MTQGKIERYHRSMENLVKLINYYYPWDLEQAIEAFADFYNHQTPALVYSGRSVEVLTRREKIKQKTLHTR